jgi:hypothetical protein
MLLGGRPQLRIICRIAAIDEDRTADFVTADKFWHGARARLDRIQRLSPRERDAIAIFSLNGSPIEGGSDTGPSEIAVTSAIKLITMITKEETFRSLSRRSALLVPGLF